MTDRSDPIRLALALGGGGARGLAHLGVLQALERDGLRPDCIVGTSIGSIVGGTFALHPDSLEITRRALAYLKGESFRHNPFKKVLFHSEDVEVNFFRAVMRNIKKGYVFSSLLRKQSIFTSERLAEVIADLVPDAAFDDTQIAFAVPAIDIRDGRDVLLTGGSMRQAMLASCSIPGFFPPVEKDGMLLMDAGVISPVPVTSALSFSPAVLVAVDISSELEHVDRVEIGLDAIMRVEAIAGRRINEAELEKADIVIRPEVGCKDWSDFSDLDELVESGIRAAKPVLPRIRSLLASKERPPRRRFWKTPSPSV